MSGSGFITVLARTAARRHFTFVTFGCVVPYMWSILVPEWQFCVGFYLDMQSMLHDRIISLY